MEYYKSNALYDYIKQKNIQSYQFVVGNAWQLVYGNKDCEPLLLAFVVGKNVEELNLHPTTDELKAFSLLNYVAEKSNLPIRYIRFAIDSDDVQSVYLSDSSFVFKEISMDQLTDEFKIKGLPVSNSATRKYLNDKTSSAYHKWQRNKLGSDLTVSDIDLWRIDASGTPIMIYELKRSYISLENWKPYEHDYRNFMLLSKLANSASLQFKIIYNERIKEPFEDKIDKLKIFSVDFSKSPSIIEEGIIELINKKKD